MVITALLAPLLAASAPLAEAPAAFFQPELSPEARTVFEARDAVPPEETRAALEALARDGDASALELLGELHMFGRGTMGKDVARACDYFEQVGDRRADSLHNLASCYWTGDGRAQDHAKARALYLKAAEAGWRMSFCAYGKMLVEGQGGPADPEEGLRLCRMTALLGDKDALTDYGIYLLNGTGTERDPATARFMLERAAEQGQASAAFLLGQIHIKGDGTPVSPKAAGEWFAKAYDAGRRDAASKAAASFLRYGYTRLDNGNMQIRPTYLREARNWYGKALADLEPGSERHQEIAKLIPLIDRLLESED